MFRGQHGLFFQLGGIGSAVVIRVNSADATAWVITNRHVVNKAPRDQRGWPVVALLFYDPQLASEPFDGDRLLKCLASRAQTGWCGVIGRSLRLGAVVGTDDARDLALLHVTDVPPGTAPIQEAPIDSIEPGDDVAAIGHPVGLLWSLTRGIVSGVRPRYPMGKSSGTIIQTQAPIAPGNSGGPLLKLDGQLIGVITWQIEGSQGLNAAIAINEVQAFASETAARFRRQ